MNAHDTDPPNLAHALYCAQQGWKVFPAKIEGGQKKGCIAGKKHGGERWGATNDEETLRLNWRQFPKALIGIATGPESDLIGIDVDTKEAHGKDGFANWRKWEAEFGLPDTVEITTASGGLIVLFRWPEGIDVRNSVSALAEGIDVRGEGGMVIAPPSERPGVGTYEWKCPPGFFEVAECPAWLKAKLQETTKRSGNAGGTRAAGVKIDTGGSAWGEAALQGEIAALFAAPCGTRNDTLNRCAFKLGQLVPGGHVDEGHVTARLTAAALSIGMDPDEIGPTIRSGLDAGKDEPREPENRDDPPKGSNAPDDIDLSHDALASDLGARSWNRDAKHVAPWGAWLFWTGTRWQMDDRLRHMTEVRAYLNTRADELTGWAERKAAKIDATEGEGRGDKLRAWAKDQGRTLRSKTTVAAVADLARSNAASVATTEDFDLDRMLLGTPGGTVDLRTGELRPARREDSVTKLTACAPADPGIQPSQWLNFLAEIFDGDQEVIDFMQRAAGYALTGETCEHKLLFNYGTGRNGKSTFQDTLMSIWHDYARPVPATTFLHSNTERHPTDIAGLQGARLAIASELPRGKTWDESTIKDLTGGDRITARRMRQDFFDFDPQLTLMIAGNNQPSFRGVDEAIRARVVLVPFTVYFPPEKRDKALKDKLKAEAPAILRWAIDGALAWQTRGLDVPASIAAASAEYFDDEDTVMQFIEDETRPEIGGFVGGDQMHERFTQWAERQGLHPWTKRTLIKELKTRGYRDARRNHARGIADLRLKIG